MKLTKLNILSSDYAEPLVVLNDSASEFHLRYSIYRPENIFCYFVFVKSPVFFLDQLY